MLPKEEIIMPYARIISTEFKSEQDLEIAVIAWKKWYPDNMPASLSRHIVRTGDKSTMMTSVYENEELLNEAQVIAAQWWELYGHHVYETIVFDGPTIDWALSKCALIIILYKICCFAKFYDCPAL